MYGKTCLPVTNSISSMTFFSVGAAMATKTRSSRTSTGSRRCRTATSRGRMLRSVRRTQIWLRSIPGRRSARRGPSAPRSPSVPDSIILVASGGPPTSLWARASSRSGWVIARCRSRIRPSGFFASSLIRRRRGTLPEAGFRSNKAVLSRGAPRVAPRVGEGLESSSLNGFARLAHQAAVEVEVVHGEEP